MEGRVGSQGLVVVEVLVAKGDCHDPLGDHRSLVVNDKDGVSGVWDCLVDRVEEASALTNLPQEEGPGIGSQPAPRKSATTDLGPRLEKVSGSRLQSVIAVACFWRIVIVVTTYPNKSKATAQLYF